LHNHPIPDFEVIDVVSVLKLGPIWALIGSLISSIIGLKA
jgi:hypothetical protein